MAVALAVTLAAGRGRAQEVCVGDCTNAGQVTVSDLVLGVNIVLGIDPASVCPNFQNAQGNVDVAQLVKGVNNLLLGCGSRSPTPTQTPIFSGKKRTFVIAPGTPRVDDHQTTSGLFSSTASNANAATAICGKLAADGQSCDTLAELHLILDDEDQGEGVHDFVLEDDATLEIGIVDGSRFCLKFIASQTVGHIACNGGVAYDIVSTRPANAPDESFTYMTNLGPVAPAGNGDLIVASFYRILPAGDATPCGQGDYTGIVDLPFTTTTGTARVTDTDLELSVSGQAFSCDHFEMAGSGGMLTAPVPLNVPGVGDIVNGLRFGEKTP